MKRLIKNSQKIVKGMSSAIVLSVLIHAALFLLAGMLVIFTVVKKEEQKFTPPKAVERPKMKLKKPKVMVNKTSKPKPSKRIVTKINRTSMPDIQLPEMSGMANGLGEGIGGFDMMPDLSEVSIFGSGQSIGNDFAGTFYDIKRGRSGLPVSVDYSGNQWRQLINKFFQRDWDSSIFARCYRSPRKLYATNFVVPVTQSALAPIAFGDENAVGALWMVHYKGELVHKEAITFRFWGMAGEGMAVRVNGKVVLALGWPSPEYKDVMIGNIWQSDSADSRKYFMGNGRAVVGDWITLEPGESLPMELLLGDNGGLDSFFLAVEVEGAEYKRNPQGAPILPAFKIAELSHELVDLIYKSLPEDEMVCLTTGPVFCDYNISAKAVLAKELEKTEPATAEEPEGCEPSLRATSQEEKMRIWTLADGRTMKAEFANTFLGKVVLKNAKGEIHKIPPEKLSSGDREYAELACPPVLDINFLKNFRQESFSGGLYDIWPRPSENWGHCGIQIKQTSPSEYNHDLQVEIFVVGKQLGGRSRTFFSTTRRPLLTRARRISVSMNSAAREKWCWKTIWITLSKQFMGNNIPLI